MHIGFSLQLTVAGLWLEFRVKGWGEGLGNTVKGAHMPAS